MKVTSHYTGVHFCELTGDVEMRLDWKYDIESRLLTLNIDEYTYKSVNGGQVISKYKKDFFLRDFFVEIQDDNFAYDPWLDEIIWITTHFSHITGPLIKPWTHGYKQKDGTLMYTDEVLGNGVLSKEDPILVDRLGIPVNVTEWWDYEKIAFGPSLDPQINRDTIWYKHVIDGHIMRTSSNNGPYPDFMHPIIHGPYMVDESDIEEQGGVLFESLSHPLLQS